MKRFSCLASLFLGSCLLSTEYVGTAPADGGLPEAGPTNPSGDTGGRGDGGLVPGGDAGGVCVPGSRTDGVWRMLPAPTTDDLGGLWASGPNDLWVVSPRNTTAHHWDGKTWTSMVTPGTTIYGLNDLWGTGPNDVWAVGDGLINHWDGTRWTASGSFLPSHHFLTVWGTGSNDVWASGSAGLLAHWDGIRWTVATPVDFPDAGVDDGSRKFAPAITALWGSGPGNLWAAGYQIFEHFDGTQWSTHMTTETSVHDIWGSGPNDIWAVGSAGPYYQEGVLYHWDGASWSATRHNSVLFGIWGAHAKDVWVVGQDFSAGGASTLMHWDGCTWSPVSTKGLEGLGGLSGAQGHLWMSSTSGVLQYQPASTGVVPGFDLHTLDPDAKGVTPVSLAVHGDVIGATYFVTPASGPSELRYVELGKQPQVVAQVTNVYGGGTLAYDATGAPNVAYLGPPGNGGAWPESKAVVARLADGVWTTTVAASVPSQVVGLYSAIAIDGNERTYVAYRDVHYGQFPVQDFQHSRVGVAWGTAKQGFQGFTDTTAVDGTNRTEGHGGHLSMALLADQPMLAYSGMPSGATDVPQDVWFIGRTVAGWPAAPTRIRTAHGPTSVSLAAMPEPQEGWPNLALAWIESDRVFLSRSENAAGTWSEPEALTPEILWTVSSASCAMDPSARPAVAYAYCMLASCPNNTELRLAFWDNGAYRHYLIDPSGGQGTKLAYWKGRAVVAYRDPTGTTIRLAVQR